MEATEETPFSSLSASQSPGLDSGSGSTCAPGWAYLHKPIIVIVMGSLMSAAGGLLIMLRSTGLTEASNSVASACLSIGLMFVVMGLVWIPVLKEKQRRKHYSQGCFLCSCHLLRITTHSRALCISLCHLPHFTRFPRFGGYSTVTMSTSVQVEVVLEKSYGGVGRCKCSFWFAVAHDILGVLIMMVGVFGGLVIHDLFIYAGAIVIFLSLIWWVFWYSGNIDVPPEELEDDVGMMKLKDRGLGRAVKRVSSRLSNGIRNSFRRNGRTAREGDSGPSNSGTAVELSTTYDTATMSPSKELVRETLSI